MYLLFYVRLHDSIYNFLRQNKLLQWQRASMTTTQCLSLILLYRPMPTATICNSMLLPLIQPPAKILVYVYTSHSRLISLTSFCKWQQFFQPHETTFIFHFFFCITFDSDSSAMKDATWLAMDNEKMYGYVPQPHLKLLCRGQNSLFFRGSFLIHD